LLCVWDADELEEEVAGLGPADLSLILLSRTVTMVKLVCTYNNDVTVYEPLTTDSVEVLALFTVLTLSMGFYDPQRVRPLTILLTILRL
jgi:hypothetical protein